MLPSFEKLDTNLICLYVNEVQQIKIPPPTETREFLLNIWLGSPQRRLTSVFDLE